MASHMPKVVLLVETSLGYGRGVFRRVIRYARLQGLGAGTFHRSPGTGLAQSGGMGHDGDHR